MKERHLVRIQDNRQWCGVAAGLAAYLHIDVALVRLFFVLTTVCCGGLGLLLYAILWLLMPEDRGLDKVEAT